MKTSSLYLGLLVSAAFLLTQCSKDESDPTPPATDFSPMTAGSTWTYKYTADLLSDTVKLTATGNTKMLNGKTYAILTADTGDTAFFAKSGTDYYRIQSFPTLGVNDFEELYLKDNAALNDTWTNTTTVNIPPFGSLGVTLLNTVKGVGESHTVLGKAYDGVTHVRLDITASIFPVGGGDFYYKKGIGMIDSQIDVNNPTNGQSYSSKQELISSDIK